MTLVGSGRGQGSEVKADDVMDSQHQQSMGPTVVAAVREGVDDVAMYSRNWAFISPAVQARLRQKVIFAAGVGLSSTVLELACRTGFTRFIVADGDRVELSNLNRQTFDYEHLHLNKAVATAEMLTRIRPDVDVTVLPEFLDEHSFQEPLARADIVINSIDFDNPALFLLNRAAQRAKKPILNPLNLGWGGVVLLFTEESPSMEEYIGIGLGSHAEDEVLSRLIERVFDAMSDGVPAYLRTTLHDFRANYASWQNVPQLGPTSFVTAAMMVRLAVALVSGEAVRAVPLINHVDLRLQLDPLQMRVSPPHAPVSITPNAKRLSQTNGHAHRPSGADVSSWPSIRRSTDDQEDDRVSNARNYKEGIRTFQHDVRYLSLLSTSAQQSRGVIYRRLRQSGLVSLGVLHSALSAEQLQALGQFRLHQYALAGLYDLHKLAQSGTQTDPGMDRLRPDTVHLLVGTDDGCLLAYTCLQKAETIGNGKRRTGFGSRRPAYLYNPDRPLFPTERELFGPGVFLTLPALRRIPLDQLRELTRLVGNQALLTPQRGAAIVEVIYAVSRVLVDPTLDIRAILGCVGEEARRLLGNLRMPVLYAPHASVVVTEVAPEDTHWTTEANAEGAFWPFVVATEDVQRMSEYFDQLDTALSGPATEIRSRLADLAKRSGHPGPQAFVPAAGTSPLLWTPDVSYRTALR